MLIGGGIGGLGAGLSAFGKENPVFQMVDPSTLERSGYDLGMQGMQGFGSALKGEVAQGSQAQLEFADLLKQYSQGGYLPGSADIQKSNELASQLFNARRVAQTQAFDDQRIQANRAAALSGRGMNDPILRAKLAQEQTRQGSLLEAEQGSFATQFAQSMPLQRAQFAGQRADVLTQRGQQALSNQGQAAQMGINTQNMFWNQRFNLAQAMYQQQKDSTSFAERLGSTLNGAMAGAGAGMQMASMGSGFGGASPRGAGGSPFSLGVNTNYGYGSQPSNMFGVNPYGIR